MHDTINNAGDEILQFGINIEPSSEITTTINKTNTTIFERRRSTNAFPQANGLIPPPTLFSSELSSSSSEDSLSSISPNSNSSTNKLISNNNFSTSSNDKKLEIKISNLQINSYDENNSVLEFKKGLSTNLGGSNSNLLKPLKKIKLGWVRVHCTGDIPTERSGHTSFFYKGNLYVFGGYGHNVWYNDMYMLDLNCLVWKELNKKNQPKPCKRLAHTMVVVGSKAYMFGGWEENDRQLNDLWEYDIESDDWKELIPSEGSELPSARFRHVCGSYEKEKKLYIFGGYDWMKHLMMNDIYEYNIETNTWKKILYKGIICGRERHACIVDEKKHLMYIFGGFNGKKFLNELHTFNFKTYEIKQVSKCFGNVPKGVRSHSFVSISNSKSAILFAGRDERDNDNNELFELNLETMKWSEISVDRGEVPQVRGRHTAVFDQEKGIHIIFGGTHSRFWYNDTYLYYFGTYHRDIAKLFVE